MNQQALPLRSLACDGFPVACRNRNFLYTLDYGSLVQPLSLSISGEMKNGIPSL